MLLKGLKRTTPAMFYVPNMVDWEILEPVQKYLPELPIATNSKEVEEYFHTKGKRVVRLPVFPEVVIMARHSCHKFPAKRIVKIGFRHGAYHFKRLTKAENYNLFDIYFVTSEDDLKAAQSIGVKSAQSIGFPKIDDGFNGTMDETTLNNYRLKANIDPQKTTLLFTSTWVKSGMSAFSRWSDKLSTLSDKYNLIVTLHPWFSEQDVNKIKSIPNLYFIQKEKTLPYIMISDICIGDSSSIMGECSALDKPLITFRTGESDRSLPKIEEMLERMSIRIDTFEQMLEGIETYLQNPDYKKSERIWANSVMFESLDGKAGERAAKVIKKLVSIK